MTLYSIKGIYLFSMFSLQGSPPLPHLDFGLCARVSPAVWAHDRIFPPGQRFPKSRDFQWARDPFFQLIRGFPFQITWLPVSWAHDPFFHLVRGFPFKNTWLPVVYEPTIPFYPMVSGIPSHFRSWRHRPIRSLHLGHLGPLYYSEGIYIIIIMMIYIALFLQGIQQRFTILKIK